MSEQDILNVLDELICEIMEKMRTEIEKSENPVWCTQERMNGLAVLIQTRPCLIPRIKA